MSQTYFIIATSDAGTVIFESAIDNFAALRSCYSGTTAPTDPAPVAGQLFFKTSTKELFQWDGAAWVVIATALAGATPNMDVRASAAAITGTVSIPLDAVRANATVQSLELLTDTATTSDGSNNWAIQLRNETQAENLRSAAFSSNGSDFVAWTPKTVSVDQNTDVAAGDALRVTLTETGTATPFVYLLLIVRMVPR